MLFSGDVLFKRRVGRTDLLHGSPDEMILSVRKLYNVLPDETIVYPAHGEYTDIGSEKNENSEIRADTVLSLN
jgi:glyoxylase-like metal-dependent hydrolase (beta-lactamase superfamily II)